ncbi:MAG: hypothetical protein JWR61_1311 [Ferruginibacter sp.]|jgi:hypothetical protein|uniref:hypothetical protein n=1 Tax=Ferruginibacter sp. TaxID=1940288 RepID=UPI002657CDB1|nr:hypothetical protein [Ferruginibacter sp.]MDB5276356.1 hypothetical protein [Ferruginibacter sp.]
MPVPYNKGTAVPLPPADDSDMVVDIPLPSVLLTSKEAAFFLRISERLLKITRDEGKIKYIQKRPNCKVFFDQAVLQQYLRENQHMGRT